MPPGSLSTEQRLAGATWRIYCLDMLDFSNLINFMLKYRPECGCSRLGSAEWCPVLEQWVFWSPCCFCSRQRLSCSKRWPQRRMTARQRLICRCMAVSRTQACSALTQTSPRYATAHI